MPDSFIFSQQAQLLIDELKLDKNEIQTWYKGVVREIGGSMIHHFLIDKVTRKTQSKSQHL